MANKSKTKIGEWRKRIDRREGKCEKCLRVYYLTVDHIIPQQFLINLNLMEEIYEWEANFRILCGACNRTKSGNLDLSDSRTLPLLKEAIAKAEIQIPQLINIDRNNTI